MQSMDRSQSSMQCNRAGFDLNRKWLLGLAAVALMAGVAFNWSWLVAAGVAPLLVGTLPCAAMCALHLCSRKSCTDAPGEVLQTRDRLASDVIAAER